MQKGIGWVGILCTMLTATLSAAAPALAQPPTAPSAKTASDTTSLKAGEKQIGPLRFEKLPLRDALAKLSQRAGTWLLADSTVGGIPVSLDARSLRLTEALELLVRQLPEATRVRFIALPAGEKPPVGDAVAQYLMAQAALSGDHFQSDAKAAEQGLAIPTAIEVLGKTLAPETAEPALQSLQLKSAYFFSAPSGDALVAKAVRMQGEGLQLWMEMNEEQRGQLIEAQFSNLLNMDPAARQAMFGQMQQQGVKIMQKLQAMPPEQRSQFFRDLTGGRWDGVTPPPRPGTPGNNPNNGGGNPGNPENARFGGGNP